MVSFPYRIRNVIGLSLWECYEMRPECWTLECRWRATLPHMNLSQSSPRAFSFPHLVYSATRNDESDPSKKFEMICMDIRYGTLERFPLPSSPIRIISTTLVSVLLDSESVHDSLFDFRAKKLLGRAFSFSEGIKHPQGTKLSNIACIDKQCRFRLGIEFGGDNRLSYTVKRNDGTEVLRFFAFDGREETPSLCVMASIRAVDWYLLELEPQGGQLRLLHIPSCAFCPLRTEQTELFSISVKDMRFSIIEDRYAVVVISSALFLFHIGSGMLVWTIPLPDGKEDNIQQISQSSSDLIVLLRQKTLQVLQFTQAEEVSAG